MNSLRAKRTPSFKLFLEFVKNAFQSQLAYRIDTLISLAGQLIILFIKISIWTAVMKNRLEISGNSVDLNDMITYAVIGTLLIIFVNRQLISQIGNLVSSGDAAIQLLRPVKFKTQTIFEQIGKNLSTFLIEFLPIFIIVNFLYRINYPGLIFGTTFFSIWILATRFKSINGWELYELILLYNLSVVSYGFAAFIFWKPMNALNFIIKNGNFDIMLTAPVKPLTHLCFRNIAHQTLGNLIMGIVVFIICFKNLAIALTFAKLCWLVITVISGTFILLSIMIMVAATVFWLKQSRGLISITFFGIKNFVDYPISVYSPGIQVLLTFIIPFGFVNFYPAQLFLTRSSTYLFHPGLQYLSPLVAAVFFGLAHLYWKISLKRYESSGH